MKHIIVFWVLIGLISCGKEEHKPYNQPFIHIMENNASFSTVNFQASIISTYNVYLSSEPLSGNVEVTFEVIAGDGLKEGEDFEMITKGNTIVFLPGIYDNPIRVRWLPSANFDPKKNNTLTISLTSNSMGFPLGLPGPSQLQKQFVITKIQ